MTKINYQQQYKSLYKPSGKEFSIVEVPPLNFLMLDGAGDPNTAPVFPAAMQALYGLAYALKFKVRGLSGVDFGVMPLEGLWWTDGDGFDHDHRERWHWTLMIMQPEHVTADLVHEMADEVAKKKKLPLVRDVRFEAYHEGLSAQILYTGSYADEGPTIARLHEFMEHSGCTFNGKHHEIYLNDPTRTAPERLQTIIRQPMRKV